MLVFSYHGQWWSILLTQWPQRLQWWERFGLIKLHLLHNSQNSLSKKEIKIHLLQANKYCWKILISVQILLKVFNIYLWKIFFFFYSSRIAVLSFTFCVSNHDHYKNKTLSWYSNKRQQTMHSAVDTAGI